VTACFSQSGSRVIEQYLALSTLGSQGFTRLVKKAFGKAARLAHLLEESGWFQCVNSYVHLAGAFSDLEAGGIPLVVFTYSQEFRQHHDNFTEAWLADELRKEGYMVPRKPTHCVSLASANRPRLHSSD
jgi:glutamate/tyrosine decarboxylase-like PLP-dependent enzyme